MSKAMSMYSKYEKELKVINESIKGKNKLDSSEEALDARNTKPDLFKVAKELYTLSGKLLVALKEGPVSRDTVNVSDVSNIVRTELTNILPDILKEALAQQRSTIRVPVDEPTQEQPIADVHTLTIEKIPTNAGESTMFTQQEWTEVVKKNLKTTLKTVPISRTSSPASSGKARLTFKTKEDMDTAKAALAGDYTVTSDSRQTKLLDPKMTIFDLKGEFGSPDDLYKTILDKNSNIKTLVDEGEAFNVIFLESKAKDWACLQMSVKVRQTIRQAGDVLNVDLQRCRVRDRYHVIQCFDCQSFGHMSGSEHCKCKKNNTDPSCQHCAGSHKSKDCRKRQEKGEVKCVNCSGSKSKQEREKCRTHSASDRLCPFYVREQTRLMTRTKGCSDAKNYYLQRTKLAQKERGITL